MPLKSVHFTTLPMSERYIRKARGRVAKLVGREDMYTSDPLANEIALAQLDATIALTYAVLNAKGETEPVVHPFPLMPRSLVFPKGMDTTVELADPIRKMEQRLDSRIDSLYFDLQTLILNDRVEIPHPRGEIPWWAFWRRQL